MKVNRLVGILFLGILIVVFIFSVFKNIQYPLLWGDESETAVFAQRIISYGYPKVNDGKNVLNMTMIPEREVGVKESIDAWIHLPWLQYYFASIGVYLAEKVSDIYLKTAFVRIPFAMAGVVGVLITPIASVFLLKKKNRLSFYVLFIGLIITNVSLALHLREVRSYSLNMLILSLLCGVFVSYYAKKLSFWWYFVLTELFLVLCFNNYPPAYIIFLASCGAFMFIRNIFYKKLLDRREIFITLLVSVVLIIPFVIFYEFIYISYKNSQYFTLTYSVEKEKIFRILNFFAKYDYLYLLILVKSIYVYIFQKCVDIKKDLVALRNMEISLFYTLFILLYIIITLFQPYIFDRYFVVLCPFIVTLILFDFYNGWSLLSRAKESGKSVVENTYFGYALSVVLILSLVPKVDSVNAHIYEISHQYKGVLDFTIPYIKNNYRNPQNLVIETNLEQTSYIYIYILLRE